MDHERKNILAARLLIAQGHAEEALGALESLRDAAQEASRARSALEIPLLMALAHWTRNRVKEAGQTLHEVLALAHSEGYKRLFLDEGEPMEALLRATLPILRKLGTR